MINVTRMDDSDIAKIYGAVFVMVSFFKQKSLAISVKRVKEGQVGNA